VLNVIDVTKYIKDKLGEISRQNARNTVITSDTIRTTKNMQHTQNTQHEYRKTEETVGILKITPKDEMQIIWIY
jgi:hypothetical protein